MDSYIADDEEHIGRLLCTQGTIVKTQFLKVTSHITLVGTTTAPQTFTNHNTKLVGTAKLTSTPLRKLE